MKFRTILFCAFALLPSAAFADENNASQNQDPQNAVSASELLPQSGTNNGGVSSTGAASYLQPNASSLQGSPSDGSNLSAPSDENLQAGATNDSLKVLLGGEADGAPKNLSDKTSSVGEDLIAIALGVLILSVTAGILRRRVMRPITQA